MSPSAIDGLRAAHADAGNTPLLPADDKLMLKARRIFDLVQKRDRHFQHALMADDAMGVMLSLFLAEFSVAADRAATTAYTRSQEPQDVVAALLDAGLIEAGADDMQHSSVALTPLGAGRMRSFISACPDPL